MDSYLTLTKKKTDTYNVDKFNDKQEVEFEVDVESSPKIADINNADDSGRPAIDEVRKFTGKDIKAKKQIVIKDIPEYEITYLQFGIKPVTGTEKSGNLNKSIEAYAVTVYGFDTTPSKTAGKVDLIMKPNEVIDSYLEAQGIKSDKLNSGTVSDDQQIEIHIFNGVKKAEEPKTKYLMGDVNADGKISAEDATLLLIKYAEEIVNGKSSADILLQIGDPTGDNKVTSEDATAILIYFAHQIVGEKLPPMEEYKFN